MANRNEFLRPVKAEIAKRRQVATGFVCESCGCIVTKFEIDHIDMDAMQIDKKRKLTAEDGRLLCIPCHDEVTAKQMKVWAKTMRQEAAHLGVKTPTRNPIHSAGFHKAPKPPKAGRARIERQPVPNNSPLAQMWRDSMEVPE